MIGAPGSGKKREVDMSKFMGSPQWLEERRKGIGASDSAAVMGLSPWRTPYQVYLDKIGEAKPWDSNPQMSWGLRMEPALRQFYSDVTNRPVRLPDKILYHSKYQFLLASLDGFTDDKRVVELKTSRISKGWGEPGTNEIPDYYVIQVQHQMIVTDFNVADVVVSIGGGVPELYEVPADKELQEMIIEAEADFWQRVVEGRPPEPVSYADAISRFSKSAAEGIVVASDEAIHAVNKLRTVQGEISKLKAAEEEIKGKLIIALGEMGDTLVLSDGTKLITYKLSKGRTTFDAKILKKELPEVYKKYLKTSEPQRRFLIKESIF